MSDYFVGATACQEDWLAVAYTSAQFDHATVFEEVGELWATYEESAERIAIDIPIGLETETVPRPNERLALNMLGQQRSPVPAPIRAATRKHRYRAAGRVYERKTGSELSEEAYEMTPYVAAVDELLRAIDDARPIFVEASPELCYLAFAGDPMEEPREFAAGYAERMRTLATFDGDAPPTVQSVAAATSGYQIPVQAVVDAVAIGLTIRPGPGSLRTLPEDPPEDEQGLNMAYVYRSESPLSD